MPTSHLCPGKAKRYGNSTAPPQHQREEDIATIQEPFIRGILKSVVKNLQPPSNAPLHSSATLC